MATFAIVNIQHAIGAATLMMKLPAAVLAVMKKAAAHIIDSLAIRMIIVFPQIIEAALINTAVAAVFIIIMGLAVEIAPCI